MIHSKSTKKNIKSKKKTYKVQTREMGIVLETAAEDTKANELNWSCEHIDHYCLNNMVGWRAWSSAALFCSKTHGKAYHGHMKEKQAMKERVR